MADDRMALQRAEFDAMRDLAQAWDGVRQTAVVDDDYPQVRHRYESSLRMFLEAAARNRPDDLRRALT